MNHDNIQEVKRWFDRLTPQEKSTMSVWVYTEDSAADPPQRTSFFINTQILQKFLSRRMWKFEIPNRYKEK